MFFSIKMLKEIFPNFEGKMNVDYIEHISIDSRQIDENSLFIPIVGDNFDGHEFIEQAVRDGAVATLWDESIPVPSKLKNDICFFYVKNTEKALQTLARHYRQDVNPIVIGITGSNGKTTTKDLVASLLSTQYKTHKTAGNYNNHIGLPLTILSMPRDTEVLVLEMGMNNFGEIDLLANIARPDYAIITNIGESHIEFLGSRKGIAKAKCEITNYLQQDSWLIIDGDEDYLSGIEGPFSIIRCSFAEDDKHDYMIEDVAVNIDTTTFNISGKTYEIPLLGAHHAKNATFALAIARLLNLSEENIRKGFKQVEPSGMRFEKSVSKRGAMLINDAYNASPTSMQAAIEVIKKMDGFKMKILVLGDIRELGVRAEFFHKQVASSIDASFDAVFTIGEHANVISEIVKEKFPTIISNHFKNNENLINTLRDFDKEGTVILFKASRALQLEKIIEQITSP